MIFSTNSFRSWISPGSCSIVVRAAVEPDTNRMARPLLIFSFSRCWRTLAVISMMSQNPEMLEKAADGFEATGDPRVKDAPKSLRESAAKLRAEQKPADEGSGG